MSSNKTTIHPKLVRSRDYESTMAGVAFWKALEAVRQEIPTLSKAHVVDRDSLLLRLGHSILNGDILIWHGEHAGKGSVHIDYRAGDENLVEALAAALSRTVGLRETSRSADPDGSKDYESLAACLQDAVQWGKPRDFLITEEALEQAVALSFNRYDEVLADLLELTEIRKTIEDGSAANRWSKERLDQYTTEFNDFPFVSIGGRRIALPQALCIPCPSSGTTLRINYAWDPKNRLHILGGFDTYQDC